MIAVVMQEPFLYSKTLRENIGLGRGSAAEEEIHQAAVTACVHESILEFEQGYDTLVGERGVTLSGGQRQRVALARALLEEPAILILDDALSAVDTETETMILDALKQRRGRHTTIVIAHRLSTLMRTILVLEAGAGQKGTHRQRSPQTVCTAGARSRPTSRRKSAGRCALLRSRAREWNQGRRDRDHRLIPIPPGGRERTGRCLTTNWTKNKSVGVSISASGAGSWRTQDPIGSPSAGLPPPA
jgi:ABC-type sulfate/molybdate transport systems ATPase subunit